MKKNAGAMPPGASVRSQRWRRWFEHARVFRPARRADRLNLVIFLALIILPSSSLTYLSWRAIESEKLIAHERLQQSHRQVNFLAARAIDDELEKVEKDWSADWMEIYKDARAELTTHELSGLIEKQPLFDACFLLRAPNHVLFPPGVKLKNAEAAAAAWKKETHVREYKFFEKMTARGEELEYRQYDLEGAIAIYHDLETRLANAQLRATAAVHAGRALIKKGDYAAAIATFTHLLDAYPEERDPNGMHLRFLAQYQIAVALENLGKDAEGLAALLRLYQDLLERSDAVNSVQYSYFVEQIQILASRLYPAVPAPEAATYREQFRALAEKDKKRISQTYFLQVLERRLNKMMLERKQYTSKFRYLSGEADGEPYLLAYWPLPDARGGLVTGLLAVQIDLAALRQKLFPKILNKLKVNDDGVLAILNEEGDYVIGTARVTSPPLAVQALAEPFDFWQVAVYVKDRAPQTQRWDLQTALSAWFVSLMLASILSGALIFIRRARREARLSQMKSDFVSSVSHELRTPLASIKMMAELLAGRFAAKSDAAASANRRAEQYLGVIQRECERLGRLIENVLSFSKIERGTKNYHFEYEEPAPVLQLALDSFRPHAEAQGFQLTAELADDLPELYLDADALVQVMLNLLSNAVKYSDLRKEIRVRAYRHEEGMAVAVSDRGIGIPAEEVSKIFLEFYRVDRRLNTPQQGGMGLGLTLAQNIIAAHGGKFEVRSELGKGSTFIFYLPAPRGAEVARHVAAPLLIET